MAETNKPLPASEQMDKGLPQIGSPENSVRIGDQLIEIKPTKLKYQRNRTAAFYRMLELYPLADILAMETGAFGDDRDGDKALMDWLIAVTDDEQLILDHYNELDTGMIEQLLQIFRRVNRMDEKEQKQKNLLTARKG